jgi:ribosome-associated toxin RatA of RatAB toxin-antitoxin module
MLRILFCLLIGGAALAQAGMPANPTLEVSVKPVAAQAQHMYEIDASASVQAPLAAAWRVLTDYEKMSEFVPDLASCKILSRAGNRVIIEQFGSARFLFMSKAIHLVVQATESPMSAIDIALISGDMRHYEARWELLPLPAGGTRITYRGRLAPGFYVPGMLGAALIRVDIERMMVAVLAHLDGARDE